MIKEYRILNNFSKYRIYEDGNVYSLHSKKFIKPSVKNNGYLEFSLSDDSKKINYRTAHSLVAEAFIGQRPDGYHICHGDNNKLNNHYSNLRYGTPKENGNDCVKFGTKKGEKNSQSKLTNLEVKLIRCLYKLKSKNKMSQRLLAKCFQVDQQVIWAIVNNKRWSHIK